ncbi:MAG TPA: hypothetical protein PKM63_22515 [Panacibacter sp.]|nr:hypothetical protein [Panacibacter sp.]HNP47087.1 hypothetical protein [Panacibacter sp.]
MRYHLYLLTLFCILFSCSQQSGSWTQFQASGLRDVNEGFERMLFVDDKIGFLFGDYTSDEAFENRKFLTDIEATIYKTKNAGKSWTRTVLGKGKFQDAFVINGIIYAVKDSFTENSYNDVIRKIYLSHDLGNTWKEELNPSFLINQIAVNNTERTAIIGDTLYTVTLYRDSLIATSTTTKESVSIDMPQNFRPEIIKADKDKLWLMGKSGNNVQLLERNKLGQYTTILFNQAKTKSSLLVAFNIIDSTISLIIVDEATIIGGTHKYFKSTDFGKTWKQEVMPSQLYADPVAFWGQDKIWTYAGAGSIQMRQ